MHDETRWAKYRKLPVVISARRLTKRRKIATREGKIVGEPGDWLVRGVKGELYPVGDDIFRETYESVDEAAEREACVEWLAETH